MFAHRIADIAKIASNGLASTPSVKTFVIGVFSQTDIGAGAASNLDKLAIAGGTGGAFIVYTTDDVTSQFVNALNDIRGGRLACDFLVPQPESEQSLDYTKVNVNFKLNKKSSTLLYVDNQDGCDPLSGGWYYDTSPATSDPRRIEVCPATCAAFKTATGASLDIAIGCQTLVK